MKKIQLIVIFLFLCFCISEAEVVCVLNQKVTAYPDAEGRNWDFGATEFCDNASAEYSKEADDGISYYQEKIKGHLSMSYYKKQDSIFLSRIWSRLFYVDIESPEAFAVDNSSRSIPFIGKGTYSATVPVREEGTLSYVPEVEGVMSFGDECSVAARMSVQKMDFVVRLGGNADSIIAVAEADTLPHYTYSIYRWRVASDDWPSAIMAVVEEKDGQGKVVDVSKVAYCVNKDLITADNAVDPENIDVKISREGFIFNLPEGYSPVAAYVAITTEGGILYHEELINLSPGQDYLLKLPNLADGRYIVAVSVNGNSFKNYLNVSSMKIK